MIQVDHETLQFSDTTWELLKDVNYHYHAIVEVYHQLHSLDIIR